MSGCPTLYVSILVYFLSQTLFRFKYLSDGTELVWSMMSEDQGPELCVMAQTVNSYDEETEEKGWKDVWNAFRCIRFGQVICQEKP